MDIDSLSTEEKFTQEFLLNSKTKILIKNKQVFCLLNALDKQSLLDILTKEYGYSIDELQYQPGVMGVPITFLDSYCPEQVEILGILQSSDEKLAGIPILREYNDFLEMRQDMSFTGSKGSKANGNPVLKGKPKKGNYIYNPNTKEYCHSAYARITIKLKI